MAITKNIIKNNYKSAEIHIRGNSADSSTILLSDIIRDNEVIVSQLQANIQSIKFGTTDTSLIIVSRGSTSIGIFNGSKNVDFSGFGMPLGNTTSINIIFNDNGHLSLTLKKVSGYSEVSSITSIESTVVGLFANGEQGVWYDPSDWTTLFQDSAGTTPVTAVGDPVGLMLDKSVSLTWTSKFSTDFSSTPAGWSLTNATISGGTLSLSPSATVVMTTTPAPTIGRRYKITYTITAITPGASNIRVFVGSQGGVARTTTGTFTDYLTYTSGAASFYCFTGAAFVSGVVDNLIIEEMIGNHAYQTTAINRPILKQDANGKYYLAFNGTNSRMQTGAINLSSTNKLTMIAGVYKVSDAVTGMIVELSADARLNNGSFFLVASNLAAANYSILVRGSVDVPATPNIAAPDVSVITVTATMATPGAFLLRMDAGQHTSSAPSFGAVNFGNYPLYIGARNASTLHFNGGLYGLVIRGDNTPLVQLQYVERYMNSKTGAY